MGANCNQAIMIVTDGVPYKYEEIFKTYNFPHKNVRYDSVWLYCLILSTVENNHCSPCRIFTYLIGREISDLKAANHMACSNRGST